MKLSSAKKWAIALVLALILFIVVVHHFFAWVTVSGNSMWPRLHDGEMLVLRRSSESATRGEVAVFEVDGRWLVKTVGFVGPGWFSIRNGDLYSGQSRDALSRMRLLDDNFLDRSQSMLGPMSESSFQVTGGRASVSDDHYHLLLDGSSEPARVLLPVDGFYLERVSASGRPLRRNMVARDLFVSFQLPEPSDGTELLLRQVLDGEELNGLVFKASSPGWSVSAEVVGGSLAVSSGAILTVGFVDGALWLIVAGEESRRLASHSIGRVLQLSQISLLARGGAITLRNLSVSADTHWGADLASPVFVPSQAVFLLGDNPGLSEDSRSFGPIPFIQMIGRPLDGLR